jgi:hypothetical protein
VLLALVVVPLLLCSCTTTEQDVMGKDDAAAQQLSQNRSWIVDSPPSTALDPANWLDYSAYWLGEIVLAPFRLFQLVVDEG